MSETITVGELKVLLTRKDVKNIHLAVHPPDGRVSLVVPLATRLEIALSYVAARMAWIRSRQNALRAQPREAPRLFVERESHYVWGRRYLLHVEEVTGRPAVRLANRKLVLRVPPGTDEIGRAAIVYDWQKSLLRSASQPIIEEWQARLGVTAKGLVVQRMKTRWGSCNPSTGRIRLNTELVKKPKDLLEFMVVHELLHLIESRHNARFAGLLDQHYPMWRNAQAELNALPLAEENWSAHSAGQSSIAN